MAHLKSKLFHEKYVSTVSSDGDEAQGVTGGCFGFRIVLYIMAFTQMDNRVLYDIHIE
jgi:hypothetical protein